MSAHAETEEHFAGSNRLFMSVWFWLLLLTGLEVFLGYVQLPLIYMLVILMGASIIKAALIVAARVNKLKHEDVEISALYWHFVDLVWLFVFPMIYLLSVYSK